MKFLKRKVFLNPKNNQYMVTLPKKKLKIPKGKILKEIRFRDVDYYFK